MPDVIRELALYKDDLSENLELGAQKIFDDVDRVHEIKTLLEEIKLNDKSTNRNILDYNNVGLNFNPLKILGEKNGIIRREIFKCFGE